MNRWRTLPSSMKFSPGAYDHRCRRCGIWSDQRLDPRHRRGEWWLWATGKENEHVYLCPVCADRVAQRHGIDVLLNGEWRTLWPPRGRRTGAVDESNGTDVEPDTSLPPTSK